MAQNRVMKAKNAKVKKLTMKARNDSARRIMQDKGDPRNMSLTLFKEKPGVCRPVRLKRAWTEMGVCRMTPKEKLILGISWGCVVLVTVYIVWAFAKYGIDPHHTYFHFF